MSYSVSIFDVAKAAGVSICTVSRVINGKTAGIRIGPVTRQHVLAVARQLGYQPDPIARNVALGKGAPARPAVAAPAMLSGEKSQMTEVETQRRQIGVVLSATSPAETLGLIPGLIPVLASADYQLVITTLPSDPMAARERVNRLLSDGVAGIICCPSLYPAMSALANGKCPVIVLWQGAGKAMLAKVTASAEYGTPSEKPVDEIRNPGSGQNEHAGNSATINLTTQQPGSAKTEAQSQAPHPAFNVVAAVTGGAGPVTSIPVSPPLVTTIPVFKPEPIIHATPNPIVSPEPPVVTITPEEPVQPHQEPDPAPPVFEPEVTPITPEDPTPTPVVVPEPEIVIPASSVSPKGRGSDGSTSSPQAEPRPPADISLEGEAGLSRPPEPTVIESIPVVPPTPVIEPPPDVITPEEPVPPPQAPESMPPVSVPEVESPPLVIPTPTPVVVPELEIAVAPPTPASNPDSTPVENSLEGENRPAVSLPSRPPEPTIIEPIPMELATPVFEPPPVVTTPEEPVSPPQAPEPEPPVSVPVIEPPTPANPTPTAVAAPEPAPLPPPAPIQMPTPVVLNPTATPEPDVTEEITPETVPEVDPITTPESEDGAQVVSPNPA